VIAKSPLSHNQDFDVGRQGFGKPNRHLIFKRLRLSFGVSLSTFSHTSGVARPADSFRKCSPHGFDSFIARDRKNEAIAKSNQTYLKF
jgi:hypothetical protein